MNKVWMPVEDGRYGKTGRVHTYAKGQLIQVAHSGVDPLTDVLPPDIRLCRLTDQPDAPSPTAAATPAGAGVPSAEVLATIKGLLESAIAGTESTIRTRDHLGLRKFSTTEEEWISRYRAALAWLTAAERGGDDGS